MGRIEETIDRVQELPTIPAVVARAFEISGREDASSAKLCEVIERDQALASKVLKITNSSFYGLSHRVSSLSHAITLLGFAEIRNITLMMSVFRSFENPNGNCRWKREKFWGHSFLCALAARMLYERSNPTFRKAIETTGIDFDFYVAGLIHDLGRLVLDRFYPSPFNRILETVEKKGIPMEEAEIRVTGGSHARIGALLLVKWRFPRSLTKAILYHHRPWEAPSIHERRVSTIIYLAECLCKLAGLPAFEKEPPLSLSGIMNKQNKGFFKSVGLSVDDAIIDQYGSLLSEKAEACQDLQGLYRS